MDSEHSSHDLSPRFLCWMGSCVFGTVIALFIKTLGALDFLQVQWLDWIKGVSAGEAVMQTPRWVGLLFFLACMVFVSGAILYYRKPFKTLFLLLSSWMVLLALTPALGVWNVFFFPVPLQAGFLFATLTAWCFSLYEWGHPLFLRKREEMSVSALSSREGRDDSPSASE